MLCLQSNKPKRGFNPALSTMSPTSSVVLISPTQTETEYDGSSGNGYRILHLRAALGGFLASRGKWLWSPIEGARRGIEGSEVVWKLDSVVGPVWTRGSHRCCSIEGP